ncbi:MAG: ribonuclease HI [SAR202 cluster bacterium]|jgi:ribonuclease HI|nr:ribonuclease HI [SAR202 cluster bacterium]
MLIDDSVEEERETIAEVTIYTDGACTGNPGPGGYGTYLIYGDHTKDLSGGYRRTTNNRMELLAVIEGFKVLKDRCDVTLYSDSKYVVDAINQGWAKRWKSRGWKRGKNENALNPDLWDELLNQLARHDVETKWVKGHAGNEGNERADKLAVAAAHGDDLALDTGYENSTLAPESRLL